MAADLQSPDALRFQATRGSSLALGTTCSETPEGEGDDAREAEKEEPRPELSPGGPVVFEELRGLSSKPCQGLLPSH